MKTEIGNPKTIGSDTRLLIAQNLNRLMQERRKTRKDVCRDLEIRYTTFCDWMNGKSYPRIESLERLAGYFEVRVGDFFIESEQNHKWEGRLMTYLQKSSQIPVELAVELPEPELKKLLSMGLQIQHKSLEDYVAEAGHTTMTTSDDVDWGEPVEGELW